MKQLLIITGFVAIGAGLISCGGASGNDPGHAYMPDMYYSRAYETYGYNDVGGEFDSLKKRGIHYTALPVKGTIARGESLPLHMTSDSAGLTAAEQMKSPLDSLSAGNKVAMKEAERLFLVNCGICHGPALDGNGPITEAGGGGYPAVPPALNDAKAAGFTDGHIFYVMTFGKGSMGSYASQLTPEQRWWVIKYIRSKQAKAATAAPKDSTNKATAGTTTAATSNAGTPK